MTDSKKKTKSPKACLDLPDAPDFISIPPDLSVAENIALCEQMLAVWNKNREEKLSKEIGPREEFYLN